MLGVAGAQEHVAESLMRVRERQKEMGRELEEEVVRGGILARESTFGSNKIFLAAHS